MTERLSDRDRNVVETAEPRTVSSRFLNLDPSKLRGGYYTSAGIAKWLCAWAIRNASDSVLEPSCGDGVFLEAAVHRLHELGARDLKQANQIFGVEILAAEADKARARLARDDEDLNTYVVETADFFAWWKDSNRPQFDVVAGNPPFIRYQSFPEPHRSRAMKIMKEQGLSPNRMTNIWVPFVVAAAASLRPGGRMAFVLPAELLQVSYAAQLRSFLTDRFGSIRLIACNELFFQSAEQEVLFLLAENAREAVPEQNSCEVALIEFDFIEEILGRTPESVVESTSPKTVCHNSEKWLKFFLSENEISLMRALRSSGTAIPLSNFASVNVGVVTGRNQYFVLRKSDIEARGLSEFTIPLISRSAHLKGARIDKQDWKSLEIDDQLVNLLHLSPISGMTPKTALKRYIRLGEGLKVHEGYKCSIREPWYQVPSVWIPDAFVFRQIYDFPRVVLNAAEATSTDTIHRMRCKNDPHLVVTNTYTSLTAASAEIEGRSYGGGILELEPREAEWILMPKQLVPALSLEEIDNLIRNDRLYQVIDENDRRILRENLGLSATECRMLRRVWEKMRDRRLSRRRRAQLSAS